MSNGGESVSWTVVMHLVEQLSKRVNVLEASVGTLERTLAEHDMSVDDQLDREAQAREAEAALDDKHRDPVTGTWERNR